MVQEAEGKISEQLMQRLRLKPEKIKQLGAGLRSIAAQDEPIGKTLSRLEVAQGLELEKVTPQAYPVLLSDRIEREEWGWKLGGGTVTNVKAAQDLAKSLLCGQETSQM